MIGAEVIAELRDICREEHVAVVFQSNHLEVTQFTADGSTVTGYASYNELIKKGAGLLDIVAYLKQTQIKDQLRKKSARERAAEAWLNQYEQQEGGPGHEADKERDQEGPRGSET